MPIARSRGWPYSHPPNTQFMLNRSSPQADGLVGWWPTLGQGGNVLRDLSGFGNNGTFTGTPGWLNGERGQVLDLPGSSDWVDLGDKNVFSPSAISWSFWAKFDTEVATQQGIISKRTNPGVNEYVIYEQLTPNYLHSIVWPSGGQLSVLVDFDSAWRGPWINIVMTYDSVSGANLYVNSVFQSNGAANGTIVDDTGSLRFGEDHYGNEFNGKLSDIRVYDHTLSASVRQEIYNPQTRWDLYQPVISRFWLIPSKTLLQSELIRSNQIPIHQLQL